MQQFLAKPDGRYRIACPDNGAGRSIDLGHRDRHGKHCSNRDLEMYLDDDHLHHRFDWESYHHNGDWRMRSWQHRLSEIRLRERRDPERSYLYGAAVGELPAAGAGDYADSDVDGRKEQERHRVRPSGFGHPRIDYAVDRDSARGAKSSGDNQIHAFVLE
jgi:hypothetical protein